MGEEVRSYFWAITLDNNKLKDVWDPERNLGPHGDALRGEHRLSVKQILVGTDSRDGDVNIVEIETLGYKEQSIKFPVSIVQGRNMQLPLNFFFPSPPVTFQLVRGTGPVYLLGNHSIRMEDVEEDLVCRNTDACQEMEFVVVDEDEDSEGQEDTSERNNRRDNKRGIVQSNNTKIRKKARCDQK